VATSLTNGCNDGFVASVFVSGTDVYAVGWENNKSLNDIAKIWKNGTAVPLPVTSTTATSFICGISVIGSDVIAAGTDAGKPIAWKNTTATAFPNTGDLSWQFVLNNDVYLAGYEGSTTTKAIVWKNGVATSLTNGTNNATATGVFVVQ
jgi:hypothetical protein